MTKKKIRTADKVKKGLYHIGIGVAGAVMAMVVILNQDGTSYGTDFLLFWGLIWFQIELFYWLGIRFFSVGLEDGAKVDTRRILWRLVAFFATVLILSAAINLIVILSSLLLQGSEWQRLLPQVIQREYIGFLLYATIGILIGTVIFFYFQWQDALKREQKLREEKLIFQYETLKNQVNPHFLFNSLNALASLVHQDPELAERFIQKLSFIYRYILEHKDKNLVSLTAEIEFVKDYFYLQKTRGQEKITLEVQIESAGGYQILPISLQLLVENALKHNTASRRRPLRIRIRQEGDRILVTNNLQKKMNLEHSSRIGLNNLAERVRLTMGKEINITQNNEEFTVAIPLKAPSYESADH